MAEAKKVFLFTLVLFVMILAVSESGKHKNKKWKHNKKVHKNKTSTEVIKTERNRNVSDQNGQVHDKSENIKELSGVAVFIMSDGNTTQHHVRYITPSEAEQLFQRQAEEFMKRHQQVMQVFGDFDHPANIFLPDFHQYVFSKLNKPLDSRRFLPFTNP